MAAVCCTPRPAAALAVRLALEPGVTALRTQAGTSWGVLGAASAGLRVGDLIWVEAWAARTRFAASSTTRSMQTVAGLLAYALDVGEAAPFVELGLAQPVLALRSAWPGRPDVRYSEVVPILGFGIDVALLGQVEVGAVVRYMPLFSSALLSSPACTIVNVRVSVCLGCSP